MNDSDHAVAVTIPLNYKCNNYWQYQVGIHFTAGTVLSDFHELSPLSSKKKTLREKGMAKIGMNSYRGNIVGLCLNYSILYLQHCVAAVINNSRTG